MQKTLSWHIPPLFAPDAPATAGVWENARRPELMRLLAENLYGVTPRRMPDRVESELLLDDPHACGGKNRHQKIRLHFTFGQRQAVLELWLYIPYGAGPFPVQMMIDPFEGALHAKEPPEYLYGFFPPDMITDRGYMAVKILASTLCPDDPARCREGILGILTGAKEGIPENHRWGAIGAWAWAGSRCVDYLLTRPEADSARIVVSGCSRAGKTALWCGAQDPRIAVVMSNVSGTGGAALLRGKIGEHISDITTNYPFWFCPQFAEYAGREDALPVDAHMLLAMAAPRPMYLASASEDVWADIDAEYHALQLAAAVWQVYGGDVALPARHPAANTPLRAGPVGYHLRAGIHDLTPYDWTQYMNFCDFVFRSR